MEDFIGILILKSRQICLKGDKMNLKLNFMSNAEIAEWASISKSYFTSRKKNWLEKVFSKYADYELAHGGVIVKKIYTPVFEGRTKKQIEDKLYNTWGNRKDKLDTCKNVSEKLKGKIKAGVKDSTFYTYVCQVKREQFGVPRVKEGLQGSCRYVYCKIRQDGTGESFNQKELEILESLKEKYQINKIYGEAQIQALGAKEDLKQGSLTQEDYQAVLDQNGAILENIWNQINLEFEDIINIKCGFRLLLQKKEEEGF